MGWLAFTFALVLAFGHVAFWTGMLNRCHGLDLPRLVIKVVEKFLVALVLLGPLTLLALLIWGREPVQNELQAVLSVAGLSFYLTLCLCAAGYVALTWSRRRFFRPPDDLLVSNHTQVVPIAERSGEPLLGSSHARLLAWFPGNQILSVHVQEKHLQLQRLPAAGNGLSIVHLSDLHFTGAITEAFFHEVVELANALDGDVIAVTGDIIDKLRCLEWIPRTLGRLRSRHGTYFVLGNHDRRIRDTQALRRALVDAGLADLGGKCIEASWGELPVLLAGNERPWFRPAPEVPAWSSESPLRVLLAHTPDQVHWARQRHFDLMLAGHNHGGQVQFPLIGPIVAPSLYGVKYAAGVFYEAPTLLHVSRGISGVEPLRLNCAPEITKLVLRSKRPGDEQVPAHR